MSASTVLVAGAGGYLGSVVTPLLLDKRYKVIAFDKFYFGTEPLADVAGHPALDIVEGDVRSFDGKLLDGVDAVIYMAALSNDPACEMDPAWTTSVNRDAAVHIAALAKQQGVKKFIFSSSCSVYGAGGNELLTEDSEPNPVSLYARTKIEAEKSILSLASPDFCPVALRQATLFGVSKRMRFDLAVNIMTLHAMERGEVYVTGGGEQWRPFLSIHDAAEAYMLCLSARSDVIAGQVFNVVGANLKIRELAELVRDRTGATVHIVPEGPDKRDYRLSGKKFEKTLGFSASVDVTDGIDSIIQALSEASFGNTDNLHYYTQRTLKAVMNRPAVEGGEATRHRFLPLATPSIGEEEEREVIDTLRSGWITTGPKTKRFEDMVAEYVGARHAIALNSCTGALHIAVAAANIGAGDEVITTPISWPATASIVLHQGATPVFVDVEPDTLNIDPSKIEGAITERTKAIIPVHMAGQPCDMDRIHSIAWKYGLLVIEDAAHAIGAEHRGRKIGSISDATAFSFYPIKNITTIEGGALTTDNDDLANRVRILSNHGISRDAWNRYSAEGSLHWQLTEPGFKYNMTDVQASLGLHQLPKLDRFIHIRAEYCGMYDKGLSDLAAVRPLAVRADSRSAHHLYIVMLQLDQLQVSRDQFMEALRKENIATGVHFISMHLQPYYREKWNMRPEDLPVAAKVSSQLLSLPLCPSMTRSDVHDVIRGVRKLITAYNVTERPMAIAASDR